MSLESEKISTLGTLSDKFSNLKVIAGGGGGVVLSGVEKSEYCKDHFPVKSNFPVALKRLSLVGKGHCRVALRELTLLKRFEHENLVKTIKITDANGTTIEDPSMENFKDLDSVYVVEELLDTDLHKILESNNKLPLETIKLFMYQLFRGIKYIHSANVIHRDIKPGNLFINIDNLTLRIGDYGLARVFDNLYDHEGYLTAVVSTRYYRAPEVMLTLGDYSFAIDIWSAGCVFGEMLLHKVLFSGDNDLDQLNVICSAFNIDVENFDIQSATFPEHWFDGIPPEAIDLLSKLIAIDPSARITAEEALEHPFFSELHDPIDEPVCKEPFYIEHEIDNLPMKVLKQKILRNSCLHDSCKSSCHSVEEQHLFKDFDETFFHHECPHDVRHERNIKFSSTDDDNSSSDMTASNSSFDSISCHEVGYRPYTSSYASSEMHIPSLTVAMDRGELTDEPFVDPGVCERKYHDNTPPSSDYLNNKIVTNISNEESSYFSDLSPVIDMYESGALPEEKKEYNPFFDHQRHSNNDQGQADSMKLKTNSAYATSEMKIREGILNKSLNADALRTLNGTVCPKTCRLEDILTKRLSTNSSQLVHWDSLRFWI